MPITASEAQLILQLQKQADHSAAAAMLQYCLFHALRLQVECLCGRSVAAPKCTASRTVCMAGRDVLSHYD